MIKLIMAILILLSVYNCHTNDFAEGSLPNKNSGLPFINMSTARAAHTAILMNNGKVLIAGGFKEDGSGHEISISEVEIFDPVKMEFNSAGNMLEKRNSHTSVLLPSGEVLIIGGWGINKLLSSCEIFNPATGKFRAAASMNFARSGFTATSLTDGKVLIAGGVDASRNYVLNTEIYDPLSNTFSISAELINGRAAHTAELLNNGKVLLIGGGFGGNILSSAEIYDPVSGKMKLTGSMGTVRYKHDSILLDDGSVLVVGGSDEKDWRGKYKSAEIYKPSEGRFYNISNMHNERFKLSGASVLMKNGKVLIAGGGSQFEIYNAPSSDFKETEGADNPYYYSSSVLLMNGDILVTGGYDNSISASSKAFLLDHKNY